MYYVVEFGFNVFHSETTSQVRNLVDCLLILTALIAGPLETDLPARGSQV